MGWLDACVLSTPRIFIFQAYFPVLGLLPLHLITTLLLSNHLSIPLWLVSVMEPLTGRVLRTSCFWPQGALTRRLLLHSYLQARVDDRKGDRGVLLLTHDVRPWKWK